MNEKNKRVSAKLVLGVAILSAGMLKFYANAEAAEDVKKPNFLIIISDDAGYVDFGFMGSSLFKTPNLDKLSREGVLCTQAYAGPTCSPSRCALYTGRYQQRSGFGRNCGASECPNDGLSAGTHTIAAELKKYGYYSTIIGKWHQGAAEGVNWPVDLGFDTSWVSLGGARSYFGVGGKKDDIPLRGRVWDREWTKRPSPVPPDPKHGTYYTDALGDETVNFIEKHAGDDKPFLAFLSFTSPHTPLQAKSQDMETMSDIPDKKRRVQAAMQLAMDRATGRAIDALDRTGIRDNTYVIFFNDNGGSFHSGINGPLRDEKGSVWEGGLRVPMIVAGPDLPRGVTYDKPVTSMNIFPTLVALAGGTVPSNLDGVDMIPFLKGEKEGLPNTQLFFRHVNCGVALREGDFKLVNPSNPGDHGKNSPGKWLLFNISKDISEKTDLAPQHADMVNYMKRKIALQEAEFPKNRWGRFGKQDRNYFDSFTWAAPKPGKWFDKTAWKRTDTGKAVSRISCQDVYPNAELCFPLSAEGYKCSNNLYSASGLDAMLNRLVFTGKGKLALTGNPLRFVTSLGGSAPVITVPQDADISIELPVRVDGQLNITGNGRITCKDLAVNSGGLSLTTGMLHVNTLTLTENSKIEIIGTLSEGKTALLTADTLNGSLSQSVIINNVKYRLTFEGNTLYISK